MHERVASLGSFSFSPCFCNRFLAVKICLPPGGMFLRAIKICVYARVASIGSYSF